MAKLVEQYPVKGFWRQAITITDSVTPLVLPRALAFSAFAALVAFTHSQFPDIALGVGPLEISGAAIGVLVVMRINAGYDRWWEARKLWGGIVNQSRNLVISALAYGPRDIKWRQRFARLGASFPFVARSSLRGEKNVPELHTLLGVQEAEKIENAQHMPSKVAYLMASELNEARQNQKIDGFAFMQVDKERALLIDHIGASERILKTPMPYVFSLKLRRFIVIYLLILPFALTSRLEWLTPLLELIIAYPLLALDQIGEELQNPFAKENLSHLPLDQIAQTIEGNLLGLDINSVSSPNVIHIASASKHPHSDA